MAPELPEAVGQQMQGERLRDSRLVRTAGAYPLQDHDGVRLVIVGAGGAVSLILNAARMGFGEYVAIDPDVVAEPNIGTQGARPEDIGQAKAVAVARRVVAVNPAAAVLAVPSYLEDIDDATFCKLMSAPLRFAACPGPSPCDGATSEPTRLVPRRPQKVVLLGLTDSFWAQARVHRLALQFGVPTICAQEYREGSGAEVTYTVPGVTPACHRCVTSYRYHAYLDDGYRNDVTSEGAPVFAAELLNAVLGHVLLAVALYGTGHPRWGGVVDRLADRNLILLRMDPDFDAHFGDFFARYQAGAAGVDRMVMLDSLFLPQTPDCGQDTSCPVCPDCGGTGDLRDAIGTFQDTRVMRTEYPGR
jgi:hypothetical protein